MMSPSLDDTVGMHPSVVTGKCMIQNNSESRMLPEMLGELRISWIFFYIFGNIKTTS
jgi:hypothetical protein